MKILYGVMLASILLLRGCNTADKYYGSGPLTLSPNVRASFNYYLTRGEPIAFAVTLDGKKMSYFYCADVQCLPDNGPRQAVDSSEDRHSQPCKLYANGKNVVWQFNGPPPK